MPKSSTASLASARNSSVGQVLQRGADDPDVRCQRGLGQVGHAGQQLASGQVAGRAEQHDDMRVESAVVPAVRAGARRRVGDGLRIAVDTPAYFHRPDVSAGCQTTLHREITDQTATLNFARHAAA